MEEKTLEHVAYKLKENHDKNLPGAIVFLGAGCSVSAGIPLASKIVEDVLEEYKEHPDFINFTPQTPYATVMSKLDPNQRSRLFANYTDKAKINVTHIYLANLIINGYVDYVVTVNFDNLMQRALALFNKFPATYDISILQKQDFGTRDFDIKSVIYLHGQHNGLWQLNTEVEMDKAASGKIAEKIFNKISANRTWIVVGYSGDDFVFDQIASMNRFYDNLYWVGYKEELPKKNVLDGLLNKKNSETYLVKKYDSDSFFHTLNTKLELDTPKILKQPFSFLSDLIENIKDINEEKFNPIKEKLSSIKSSINNAINNYEAEMENINKTGDEDGKAELNKRKIQLTDLIANNKFEEFERVINEKSIASNPDLTEIIANGYACWGNVIFKNTQLKSDNEKESFLNLANDKFKRAVEINPKDSRIFFNWGAVLGLISNLKPDNEKEDFLNLANDKFKRAAEINPKDGQIFYFWGLALRAIAKLKPDDEKESFFNSALEIFNKAIQLGNIKAHYNIACLYAVMLKKDEAFKQLEMCLKEKYVEFSFVEQDKDWNGLRNKPEYLKLKEIYGNN